MDPEEKIKLAQAFKNKGVKLPCPRCSSINFEVVGKTALPLNDNPQAIVIGGPTVPAALLACSDCGFITLHALGILNNDK